MSIKDLQEEIKTEIEIDNLTIKSKVGNTTVKIDKDGHVFIFADNIQSQGGVK